MTQTEVRRRWLRWLLIPLGLWLIPMEYYNLVDSALFLYSVTFILIVACGSFWIIWASASKRKPSTIFVVNGLLLGGIGLVVVLNIYTRYIWLYHQELYAQWVNSNIWAYRISLEMLIFAWLWCWFMGRMFGEISGGILMDGKLNILIVEDDKALSDMVKSLIDTIGSYNVVQASTYEDALAKFHPSEYFCSLIDLHLGNSVKEGIGLAWEIRQADPDIYLVVMSGYFDKLFNPKLMESVDDFVQKPFELALLKLKIFLWTVKYKRRLLIRKYVDESDFNTKMELTQTIDTKLKNLFKKRKGEK